MTICNMAIEAGARAGIIGVDDRTLEYVADRPFSPKGVEKEQAEAAWRQLVSDPDAHFDKVITIDISRLKPQVSWGTSPEMVVAIDALVPDPAEESSESKAEGMRNALRYMGLAAGQAVKDIVIDKVFIGSCTNSRIEDLRAAAAVVQGRHLAENIKLGLIVPGSGLIKQQAEAEGCLLYTSPSPRDRTRSRMPSSA